MRPMIFGFGLTIGLASFALLLPHTATGNPRAPATIRTVTNTNDSGAGSLRQAIIDAAAGDTINFNLTYPAVITLTSGQLSIAKNIMVSGPGAANLTLNGNGAVRVFNLSGGVTISGLTVARASPLP